MSDSTRFAHASVDLALAHGITSRVAATWYPALLRDPRVLVPIQVDGLVVRSEGDSWAAVKMSPPPGGKTDTPTKANDLMPPPFTPRAPRARGVYLHWYLPSALTTGNQPQPVARGAVVPPTQFPAIPDRWLVVRISSSPNVRDRRTITGWILETGGEPPVQSPLDNWVEMSAPTNAINPLTALGHGDLSWAGYYDNVEKRLAFYDPVGDAQGPFAYLVCGWYSDTTLDPLGDQLVRSLSDFDAKMHKLRWELRTHELHEIVHRSRRHVAVAAKLGLQTRIPTEAIEAQRLYTAPYTAPEEGAVPAGPPYVTDGSWWPQGSLFHGSVVGIGWPDVGWPGNENGVLSGEEGGPPSSGSVSVCVANTMAEAMGTIIARDDVAPQEAPILEGFSLGVLSELDEPDGRAQLDVRLHASSFGSRSGGTFTETVHRAASGPPTAPDPPPPQKPGIFPHRRSFVTPKAFGFSEVARGSLEVPQPRPPVLMLESSPFAGRLSEVISKIRGPIPQPYQPARDETITLPAPRFYTPMDPIVLVQGAKRSFTHGSDLIMNDDGTLQCRLSTTTGITWLVGGEGYNRHAVSAADILDRGIENGSVPPQCEDLLNEVVLLDPGSAYVIGRAASRYSSLSRTFTETIATVMVEQTAWWSLRDPRVDHAPLISRSGFVGTLPAAVSVTPPWHPWRPMHIDWKIEYFPSLNGARDWELGELDYVPVDTKALPAPGTGIVFSGRGPVSGGASTTLAAAIRKAVAAAASIGSASPVPASGRERFPSTIASVLLETIATTTLAQFNAAPAAGASDGVPAIDRSVLGDIATELENIDVLNASFTGLIQQLRDGIPGDGASAGTPDPAKFFAMRGGYLRVDALRIVDGFGQYVDLAVDASKLIFSAPLSVDSRPDLVALPPRFTAPARVWFRYMTPDDADEADATLSPVCGFVMPNHLEGALEFFDADGTNAGIVRPNDDGRVLWEDAPGSPSSFGQDPARALSEPHIARLASSLLDWSVADARATREPVLSALLRVIDSTLWAVDLFGHIGDEHLSLLVGHPVCVMRAMLRLDIQDPIPTPDTTVTAIPVRLGALAQWQDGLLGYFVDDDYTKLYVADAAAAGLARQVGPQQGFLQQINLVPPFYQTFADDVASGTATTPVTHPYIDTTGFVWIRPNQTLRLTMLVEPHGMVNATSGIVPRKEIGMRREWVAPGLAKIAPTFRFGPVLLDPQHIRMPIATDLNGTWSWDYRSDANTWVELPVTNSKQDALLQPDPPTGIEGWLKLEPPPSKSSTS
jgi:hypothetical protein